MKMESLAFKLINKKANSQNNWSLQAMQTKSHECLIVESSMDAVGSSNNQTGQTTVAGPNNGNDLMHGYHNDLIPVGYG